VWLHLLPFYPSSGDSGFAPDDWFSVDPSFGTVDDLADVARSRPVIIDGVYNHVGLGHPLTERFCAEPTDSGPIVAFRGSVRHDAQASPRGGSALRPWILHGEEWTVWQTFNDAALDVDLDHPTIRSDIVRHLDFLVGLGVRGLRVDAPAYYAKRAGERQRHHDGSVRLAREVTQLAHSRALFVTAQLDADSDGARYFAAARQPVPIVDYAYSPHLALALASEDPRALAHHLAATQNADVPLLRAPRTHDGVLMRSKNLGEAQKRRLVDLANAEGLSVRVIDDDPYELNASFPRICAIRVSQPQTWQRLELAIALTCFLPGVAYLYLPMLLGYTPEYEASPTEHSDPRVLNRLPMPTRYVDSLHREAAFSDLLDTVGWFSRQPRASLGAAQEIGVRSTRSVLTVLLPKDDLAISLNLSTSEPAQVPSGRPLHARRYADGHLGPLGFVVSVLNGEQALESPRT
jgi:hypothetical protein